MPSNLLASAANHYTLKIRMNLSPKDQRHFDAAEGWMELGHYAEAKRELQQIDRSFWDHPEILELRWNIDSNDQNWDNCLKIAQCLISTVPTNDAGWFMLARSLERTSGPEAALQTLDQEIVRQPQQPFLRLEAAILSAKLKRFDDALQHLNLALGLAKDSRQLKDVRQIMEKEPVLEVLAKQL